MEEEKTGAYISIFARTEKLMSGLHRKSRKLDGLVALGTG